MQLPWAERALHEGTGNSKKEAEQSAAKSAIADFDKFYKGKNAMFEFEEVKNTDQEIYDSMMRELNRQEHNIELIASENFVFSRQ